MIYNLRGTHGSGKSTVIQNLIKKHDSVALGSPGKKPEGYRVTIPGLKKPLFIVGPYHTQCGGCDAIQPYDDIWPRVVEYARKGHVLFEGALISVSVGSIGLAMAARKKEAVVLYLDTPLEVALERIRLRRAAKGDFRPLDPKNTEGKHRATERTRPKMETLGVRCVTINHKKATKEVLEVIFGSK